MPYSKRIEKEIEAKQDEAEQKRTEVNHEESPFSEVANTDVLRLDCAIPIRSPTAAGCCCLRIRYMGYEIFHMEESMRSLTGGNGQPLTGFESVSLVSGLNRSPFRPWLRITSNTPLWGLFASYRYLRRVPPSVPSMMYELGENLPEKNYTQ